MWVKGTWLYCWEYSAFEKQQEVPLRLKQKHLELVSFEADARGCLQPGIHLEHVTGKVCGLWILEQGAYHLSCFRDYGWFKLLKVLQGPAPAPNETGGFDGALQESRIWYWKLSELRMAKPSQSLTPVYSSQRLASEGSTLRAWEALCCCVHRVTLLASVIAATHLFFASNWQLMADSAAALDSEVRDAKRN